MRGQGSPPANNSCTLHSCCLLICRRKLEKLRKKLKASQREVQDLQSEFQVERDDFLETIRGAERELKLFTAIAKRYCTSRLLVLGALHHSCC